MMQNQEVQPAALLKISYLKKEKAPHSHKTCSAGTKSTIRAGTEAHAT